MSNTISIEDVISCIRDSQGIAPKRVIQESSLIEDDLGITGDDGCDLLTDIEKRFGISFKGSDGSLREAFDLEPDEYLFHSEGCNPFALLLELFGRTMERVKPITVGDLHRAILKVGLQPFPNSATSSSCNQN